VKNILAVLLLLLLSACAQAQSVQLDQSVQADQAVQAVSAPIAAADQGSVLVFEPDHVDMGSVKEGEDAVVFIRVRNAGSMIATIASVETSCGCSVAEPEERLLMPGGFTRIKVVVDTFAKQGDAKKWVQLTDDLGHRSKAWLTLNVQPNPHLSVGDRSIFKGKCAACHYDTAQGKVKGPEIFKAVCSMCHGDQGQGATGPSLRHHKHAEVLAVLIANGTGSHHMPGFALAKGGPLTKQQITELSRWLSGLDEMGQNR